MDRCFLFICTFLGFATSSFAAGNLNSTRDTFGLVFYCSQIQEGEEAEFINQFPYEAYQRSSDFQSPSLTIRNCIYLQQQGIEGTGLLLKAYVRYQETWLGTTQAPEVLLAYQQTGIRFLQYPDTACNRLATHIGEQILGPLAYHVQSLIDGKTLNPKDNTVSQLIKGLEANKFLINLPESKWHKGLRHLKEGNWNYLWNRFQAWYLEKTLYWAAILFSVSMNFILYRKNQKLKKA